MVTFDPSKTSYEKLLDYALRTANLYKTPPAVEGCRNGARQYISCIWPRTPEQTATLRRRVEAIEKASGRKVTMCLDPLGDFYYGEQYHQQYSFQPNQKQLARKAANPHSDRRGYY